MRVAQMGMGVVTVAAQRGNFTGNGLGGTAGLVIMMALTAAAMKNNTAQTCSSRAKLVSVSALAAISPTQGRGDQRREPARGVSDG